MERLEDNKLHCCFQDWMKQEQSDLTELLQTLKRSPADDEHLCLLAEKVIKHFEEYISNRAVLAQRDAPSLLYPSWCTSFENAFFWIGGYKPSLSIRLVFSLLGSRLEDQPQPLAKSIEGESKAKADDYEIQPAKSSQGEKKVNSGLGDLSPGQLNLIKNLYHNAVKEEEKLSNQIISFQENVGDDSVELTGKNWNKVDELNDLMNQSLDAHSLSITNLLVEADNLRLSILRELVLGILKPLQSVEFLIATKKLHISMHEWGKKSNHGRLKTPEFHCLTHTLNTTTFI